MRVVQINTVPNNSTATIMKRNHERYLSEGHESWIMWGRGRKAENPCEFYFGSKLGVYSDVLKTRIFGHPGFYSKHATKKLLKKLDEIQPDLVHFHNLHGYYINVGMLFEWLQNHDCKVEWTLHDCWAFTGHCAHFTYVNCQQWKSKCSSEYKCPQPNGYPRIWCKTIAQRLVGMDFDCKKELFTSLTADRLKIITPSKWLANLVKESFLSKYEVEVRYNTIDTSVFKPTPSDFRKRFGLEGKYIILGVANVWTERKGLNDFVRLANELDDRFAIVLVGLSKKQIKLLPDNILKLPRTRTPQELAALYTAADVHVQPSVEETFGMTVCECLACDTKVIVRRHTACSETARLYAKPGYSQEIDWSIIALVEGVKVAVETY